MDYGAAKFWFDVAQFSLTGAIAIYVWLVTRSRVTADKVRDLEMMMYERTNRHADLLTRLETELSHTPSHKDIEGFSHHLSLRIDTLHGDLSKLTGAMQGLQRSVDLMNEHLLNRERS